MTAVASSAARKTSYLVVTHRDPDIDDIEAMRLLMDHGSIRYPGVKEAKFHFTSNSNRFAVPSPRFGADEIICIGVAGSKFDEHARGDTPRKHGESAATLMAKDLGVENDPAIKATVAYALEKNRSAITTEFEIAPLLKLAFRFCSHDERGENSAEMAKKILSLGFLFMRAAERNESAGEPSTPATMTMDEITSAWIVETFGVNYSRDFWKAAYEAHTEGDSMSLVYAKALRKENDPDLGRILEYAKRHGLAVGKQRLKTKFDLATLVALAEQHFCTDANAPVIREKISGAVKILLTAMWKKETSFHVLCQRDFDSSLTRFETIRTGGKIIRVVSVVSANSEMQKFCRSKLGGSAMVTIQRHPKTGNTCVFFDQKAGVDPKPLVAAIRIAERQAHGKWEKLSQAALEAEGEVEGALEWYFDGFQILNGSLTTERPATQLLRSHIEAIVLKTLKGK